ncbi:MAG: tetratricopeptide repeat protein [Deltaproteobacteria bacterium]|nr:tetratricopeptide repeat protein [Deltaproteobacteria bacterium]
MVIEKKDGEFRATGEGLDDKSLAEQILSEPSVITEETDDLSSSDAIPLTQKKEPVSEAAAEEIVEDMLTLMRPRLVSDDKQESSSIDAAPQTDSRPEFSRQPVAGSTGFSDTVEIDQSISQPDNLAVDAAAPQPEDDFFKAQAAINAKSAFADETNIRMPSKRSSLWWALAIIILGGGLGLGGWFIHQKFFLGKSKPKDSITKPVDKHAAKTSPKDPVEPTEPVDPDKLAGKDDHQPGESEDAGDSSDDENEKLSVQPLVPELPDVKESKDAGSGEIEVARPKEPVEKKPPIAKKPVEKKPPVKKPVEKKPPIKKPGVKVASAKYFNHLKRGQALYKAGKIKAAAQALNMAIKANSRGVEAMVALANAYFEMDKNSKAIGLANQALKINPRSSRAHLTLGTIYQTIGKNKQARKSYRAYLKLNPKGRFASDVRSILKTLK